MKLRILFFIIFILCLKHGFSQQNCTNPVEVVICPDTILSGQTNAGMIDDGPPLCNSFGEDVVYHIKVTNAAQKIFVTLLNSSGPGRIILEQNTCGGTCSVTSFPSGNTNKTFTVAPANDYYIWIDAATTINYDIEFGADTGTVVINIPNTQGNLQLDSSICNVPVFHPSKPFFQVSFNGDFKTHPMTLTPLFVPGQLCVTVFFKNTTGDEGIRQFEFEFNPAGFMNVTTVDSFPGFYNNGFWRSSFNGAKWIYIFDDSLATGKGDFTGNPDSCLAYQFCFTVTPLSNDPALTDVGVLILSDGFGAPYTGTQSLGCCPGSFPNCMGSGGSSSGGSGQAFGFAFADPGDPLPIDLLSFTAETVHENVVLKWVTATEVNNDYFTIERSADGTIWKQITKLAGAGNSTNTISYTCKDENPLDGISYYRLRQTDFDGQSSYSNAVKVTVDLNVITEIFPNPADQKLTIKTKSSDKLKIYIFDSKGIKICPGSDYDASGIIINTSTLMPGIFMILVFQDDRLLAQEKIVVSH